MNDIQFTLVRFVSIPVALLFTLDWVLLPSKLQVSKATEQVASAKYGKFKGNDVVYLQTQAAGELRIYCSNAGQLCLRLQQAPVGNLKVWLQEPALLHGPWIVAAEGQGGAIVKSEDNTSAYREFKIVWAIVVLVMSAVAFVSWYFAPFDREIKNAA